MDSIINSALNILSPIRAVIEIPLGIFLGMIEFENQPPPWVLLAYDLVVIGLLIYLGLGAIKWARELAFGKPKLTDKADIDRLVTKNQGHVQTLEAAQNLELTIAPLKRSKEWDRLADVYASLNRPKEAAKYFLKAKDHKRAAEQFAKAGDTVKAAKLLMKAGDFYTAGRFYLDRGKHKDAAKAFLKAGAPADAGAAYAAGGKFKLAFEAYAEYFQAPKDAAEAQARAAQQCYDLIRNETAKASVEPQVLTPLLPKLAKTFEAAKQYPQAGQLYRESGDLLRAGQVYLLAGKLPEAAACMKEAGNPKEAARITGQAYEQQKKFKEAAQAYTQAEEWYRAGECFAQSKEPVRAAECYFKGKSFYKAGLAYAHAAKYEDAVGMFQRMSETDPNFEVSRGILGRCFYEVHDYAHCVAALENHLTGQKVEKTNIELWNILGLAYEQNGQLSESRGVLLKIGAVNKGYKDINARLSNIESRISMLGSRAGATPTMASPIPMTTGDDQVMKFVAKTLEERYEIEAELGRGGMGVVYKARDKQLDRLVALKFLGSMIDHSDEFKARFVREAKTAAKVNHPNIVAIYDISASQGKAYIAMEYVEGQTLNRYLRSKGKLAPREAVNIMGQACNALAAMHEAGVVHRDLKPDNIFIAKGGLVKVMDFGLAKAEDNRITRSNVVMGTPSYMSPEQATGQDVDPRADIYSMGLVLHEMLTGNIVFLDGDVMQRQLTEMPEPPGKLVEGVPAAIDTVVMKCIAKNRDERYATTRELLSALSKAKEG